MQAGQRVRAGDTLGLVGNTGNARNTNPHLHFGVYRSGQGAVDPLPFVRRASTPAPLPDGADRRGEFVRLRAASQLHPTPTAQGQPAVVSLLPQVPLLVLGQQGRTLRVQTPGGTVGYVLAQAVVEASAKPLRRVLLPNATELRSWPGAEAPAGGALAARTTAVVLGQAEGYSLLLGAQGETGWALL